MAVTVHQLLVKDVRAIHRELQLLAAVVVLVTVDHSVLRSSLAGQVKAISIVADSDLHQR